MDFNKSHHHHQPKRNGGRGGTGREKDAMKVVYISTPMKVKTSASKFREVVQELTGRESDVVRIMESSGGRDTWTIPDHDGEHPSDGDHHHHQRVVAGSTNKNRIRPGFVLDPDSLRSSPSSSEELKDPFDNRVLVRGEEGFGSLDCPSLLYDQFCHQLDALGSY